MRKQLWWIFSALLVLSVTIISWRSSNVKHIAIDSAKTKTAAATLTAMELFNQSTTDIYNAAQLQQSGLDEMLFHKAVTGYYNLKMTNKLPSKSTVITIVDFTKSSRTKRMWIVDLQSKKLILNTWVAHGQGSGDDMAVNFSNTNNSHQSSLGFYVTDGIYYGKHGRSLKLDGMDAGFNSNARDRAIVIHAADYVSQGTINQLGRLGRSHGCPAVSNDVVNQVIDTVKDRNMLFINGNNNTYASKYLNEAQAADYAFATTTASQTTASL